jgi:hypothetical protein
MYIEPATPRPRPRPSWPRRAFQPEAVSTVEALQEPVGGDLLAVHGVTSWPMKFFRRSSMGSMPSSLGQLVELHLEGEAGLHAAVPALRAAARLVGVHARGVEGVGREVVGPVRSWPA